ncbi:recombinase family protein [Plantibacter sp. RU18]|uniref:recombinase family protein n=1 Tax=Plantibacter sp. RU18 TaxID=3158143 RepID=UPI003D35B62E
MRRLPRFADAHDDDRDCPECERPATLNNPLAPTTTPALLDPQREAVDERCAAARIGEGFRPADEQLIITHLDRLGRSVLHLATLGSDLRQRGVGLRVLEQGINTTTARAHGPHYRHS